MTQANNEKPAADAGPVDLVLGPLGDGRAAFERHAASLGYSADPDTRPGREGGYWSSHTHLMWETWQAAHGRCAKICDDAKPPGGRMWTDEQAACFDCLTHVAEAIRA